uniref:Protein involved in rrna processing n=1 Tax=Rhodnius prolixus TaxID=13249 RepID=T1HB58_RHOPR
MEETQDGCIEKKEEALHLLKEIGDGSKQAGDILQQLLLKIRNKQVNIENGIGFFDVKNQLLIFYLINLCQLIILKASGKSIEENSAIERLVELRVTLDKIRPIDQKLKYQVEKLVKIAIKGARNENDPCRFKANPGNMTNESKLGNNEKLRLYCIYGDDTYEIKKQKIIDRARKHALRSSVMEELKEQYLDTPVEIVQTNSLKQKEDKYQKHKQEYEENYLTRLPVTKEELRRKKRISTLGTLGDEITRFENTSILHKEQDFSSEKKKSRKRKAAKGKKNSRGKKKRKLH